MEISRKKLRRWIFEVIPFKRPFYVFDKNFHHAIIRLMRLKDSFIYGILDFTKKSNSPLHKSQDSSLLINQKTQLQPSLKPKREIL